MIVQRKRVHLVRSVHPTLFIGLVAGFIGFTIMGTLSHEAGRYVVARCFGIQASVHYAYTHLDQVPVDFRKMTDTIKILHTKHQLDRRPGKYNDLSNSKEFPDERYYEATVRKQRQTFFLITLGGPLQTMLTGTLGFLLLMNRRWWIRKEVLTAPVWVVIFTALFWQNAWSDRCDTAGNITWIQGSRHHGLGDLIPIRPKCGRFIPF